MGYPIEVANAIPKQPEVPVRDPLSRRLLVAIERIRNLWRRRKRTLQDAPNNYRQGVNLSQHPLQPGDSAKLEDDTLRKLVDL